jgi:Chaperone of endosialidase
MNPLFDLKKTTPVFLIAVTLACFALSPEARALLPAPTPDGAYPGWNTAEGSGALFKLTTGAFNTAIGGHALYGDTTDSNNTAVGAFALAADNPGSANVAVGQGALRYSSGSSGNVAVGFYALHANTDGSGNTAMGNSALYTNTTGYNNTAAGVNALLNSVGIENTATGAYALGINTSDDNTAAGAYALESNTTGKFNIALGVLAGSALTTGDCNIDIGNEGVIDEGHTIRIGDSNQTATYIAGISGQTVSAGVAVYVNADGKLGTVTSSRRFKDDIKPMEKASEAILALKPVCFRYKHEIDPAGASQFGLVAEDVEKVNRDLVVRDKEGKPYGVRCDQVNAMLLNEFLKEHKTVQEQGATITALKANEAKQEAMMAQQQKQIEALSAGLQKVSAQLEASKPAQRVVNNNQ